MVRIVRVVFGTVALTSLACGGVLLVPRFVITQAVNDRKEEMGWFVTWLQEWAYSYQPWLLAAIFWILFVLTLLPWDRWWGRKQLVEAQKGRTILEKHRAREQWRGRIDDLVKSAPESGRSKNAAQSWQEEVTVAFDNLLVGPAEKKKRFLELTEGIRMGGDVKEAIRRGVRFLRDIRDTIKEGDLR